MGLNYAGEGPNPSNQDETTQRALGLTPGSNGMIHYEDAIENKPLMFYDKTVDLDGEIPKSRMGQSHEIKYKNQFPLTEEIKYFISKIDKGKIEIANGDSAVEVMKILDKATKSLIR